jgi:hypothetical protein
MNLRVVMDTLEAQEEKNLSKSIPLKLGFVFLFTSLKGFFFVIHFKKI